MCVLSDYCMKTVKLKTEHFIGYGQKLTCHSIKVLLSFSSFCSKVSDHNRTLSFQAKIGHATCGWNLSGNNYSLVHIDESPEIDSSKHDMIVCSCSTNLYYAYNEDASKKTKRLPADADVATMIICRALANIYAQLNTGMDRQID